MLYDKQIIAGVDEAGRGPLFGPVVACAVVFNQKINTSEIIDSKKISPRKREKVYSMLLNSDIDYGIGVVHEDVIDKINILNATKKAMLLAIKNLKKEPNKVLIDGNQFLDTKINQETIIKGDQKIPEISAASIIAKVTRDRMIDSYSQIYPMFDLSSHKGYGTKKHIEHIYKYGPSQVHRFTFKPISDINIKTLVKYESSILIKYAIGLIKKGHLISLLEIESKKTVIRYKKENIDVYVISMKNAQKDNSFYQVISDIKKKDSVKNGRLDVIYEDESPLYIKPNYSCKIDSLDL